jgi:hypothetical protein
LEHTSSNLRPSNDAKAILARISSSRSNSSCHPYNVTLSPSTRGAKFAAALQRLLARQTDLEIVHIVQSAGVNVPEKTVLELGSSTQFTCPECEGSLIRITEGGVFRFRCHTGHGYTAEALLADLMETIDVQLWQTIRGLQEGSMLLEHIGRQMQENGGSTQAEAFLSNKNT